MSSRGSPRVSGFRGSNGLMRSRDWQLIPLPEAEQRLQTPEPGAKTPGTVAGARPGAAACTKRAPDPPRSLCSTAAWEPALMDAPGVSGSAVTLPDGARSNRRSLRPTGLRQRIRFRALLHHHAATAWRILILRGNPEGRCKAAHSSALSSRIPSGICPPCAGTIIGGIPSLRKPRQFSGKDHGGDRQDDPGAGDPAS